MSGTAGLILVDRQPPLAVVTLNEPDKRNPLSPGLVREATLQLERLAQDDEIRAVIVTGAGPAFCGGADIRRFRVMTATVAGIPASPINSVEDVLKDPQTEAREMILSLSHPTAGPIRVPGPAIKLSDSRRESHEPPPTLGQHTAAVLGEIGYGPDAVTRFRAEGAI